MSKTGTHPRPVSFSSSVSPRRRRHPVTTALLFAAVGLFGTAAALAVVQPVEPPAVYQAQTRLSLPSPTPLTLGGQADPYIHKTQIRRGDTLAALLQRLGVQEAGLQQFLVQSPQARSIYKLIPGRSLQAALDGEGNLVWLRYHHTPGTSQADGYVAKWLEVSPKGDGFLAEERHAEAVTHANVAEGVITSSLFGATDAAGIPDAITLQMAEILGSKIDFMRDLREGDWFRVVYETYSHQGAPVGSGRLLAVEFRNRNKTHEAAWFDAGSSGGGYYNFQGESLKGAFLRSALKFTRISSTFGRRTHPVLGYQKGHTGVDYAAPTGTPIHATGDGVVDFIGRQGGYGNLIILRHQKQYATYYAHQSRFAAGLKKGDRVSQGQLIGYVGSTGMSTGPHLHYEFRISGKPVDPLSVDLPVAIALEGKDKPAFQATVAQYRDQFGLLTGQGIGDDAALVAQR